MICEFCNREFSPRPQVKCPRACFQPLCQASRQRTNEKDWRVRQSDVSRNTYDSIQRSIRLRAIEKIVAEILKCLGVGRRLSGLSEFGSDSSDLFTQIFLGLGLRRTTKFWTA